MTVLSYDQLIHHLGTNLYRHHPDTTAKDIPHRRRRRRRHSRRMMIAAVAVVPS